MKKGSKIFKKNDNSQKDNTLNYSSFAKTIRRSDHTIMVITKVDIATVSFAKTIRQRQRHTILVFIFSKDYFLQWRMLLQQTAAKVI